MSVILLKEFAVMQASCYNVISRRCPSFHLVRQAPRQPFHQQDWSREHDHDKRHEGKQIDIVHERHASVVVVRIVDVIGHAVSNTCLLSDLRVDVRIFCHDVSSVNLLGQRMLNHPLKTPIDDGASDSIHPPSLEQDKQLRVLISVPTDPREAMQLAISCEPASHLNPHALTEVGTIGFYEISAFIGNHHRCFSAENLIQCVNQRRIACLLQAYLFGKIDETLQK